MSHAGTISRGARVLVLAGAGFLVAATVAAAIDAPRATVVGFALYGFVLHTVFGKAYSLVPAYFDRDLAAPRAPLVQAPLSVLGALGIALAPAASAAGVSTVTAWDADAPALLARAGATLWGLGAAVFLAAIAWTIRDNLSGAETATAASKADHAEVDRIANTAMPAALAYLALGAYETVAVALGSASLTGTQIGAAHLLAVGTASLLVFAVGARLLPRLLSATVPTWLVVVVLVPGVTGPALLAAWFTSGAVGDPTLLLWLAITALAVAVVGHATLVGLCYRQVPSPRIGVYGVVAGAIGGLLTIAVGAAVGAGWRLDLLSVHPRLGLVGFLGLTIVGVAYHFYPPVVADDRADWVAAASILLLGAGLLVELVGVALDGVGTGSGLLAAVPVDALASIGQWLAALGALAYAGLLAAIFRARANRG